MPAIPRLPFWLLLLCLLTPALAQPPTPFSSPESPLVVETPVPDPLLPWVPWVTRDLDNLACPPGPTGLRICAWPGRLSLHYDRDGALFTQTWRLYAPTQVTLPGDHGIWPDGVTVDGQPVLVIHREGRPELRLEAGRHEIAGVLPWPEVPNTLKVPEGTSSVRVTGPDGRPAPARWTRDGQVWLGAGPPDDAVPEDRMTLRLYRRLSDELPPRLETRLELDVAGRTREQVLIGLLPEGFVAVELNAPLPARWEGDEGLRLTLRPGNWRLTLSARGDDTVPLEAVGPPADSPATDGEIWAFEARPDLRRVTFGGGTPLDPRSTALPGDWQSLPAFLLEPGERLTFTTQQRGSPLAPDNRLILQRELWRDLDGTGWTFRDRIDGELNRHWRLEAGPALDLGRAVEGGEPRILTRLEEGAQEGVELRRHRPRLLAEGRLAPEADLPANGWSETMTGAELRLHLPPGWQLLHVAGAQSGDTWAGRWSTLDLFLLIVLSYGAWRLWGPLWALLLGTVLVLTLQAPGAAVWPWVLLLVAAGLLQALRGQTRLRRAAGWLRAFALAALVLNVVPYLAGELRLGLYPQLDRAAIGPGAPPVAAGKTTVEDFGAGGVASPRVLEEGLELRRQYAAPAPEPAPPPSRFDPDAKIPTGPGVPDWQGRVHNLTWSGPVAPEQTFAIVLLSPGLRLLLALVLGGLVAALAVRALDLDLDPGRWRIGSWKALTLLVLMLAPSLPVAAQEGDYPPPHYLQELRQRLTEDATPRCLPDCAAVQALRVTLEEDRLVLDLRLHVAALAQVALPVDGRNWTPELIRTPDGDIPPLRRDGEGRLSVALPAGEHRLVLAGAVEGEELTLPLPLPVHNLALDIPGWEAAGVEGLTVPGGQLQLRRLPEAGALDQDRPQSLAPDLEVTRTLMLGPEQWTVSTRVRRLTDNGVPARVEVPLLEGEAVTAAGIQVRNGRALVLLPAGGGGIGWQGTLERAARLTLTTTAGGRWREVWQLTVDANWRVDHQGPPPVAHLDPGEERWQPRWRPYRGESLAVTVTRPAGVPGVTATVTRAALAVQPGADLARYRLTFTLLSGQGGRHSIELPPGAEPVALTVDGRAVPLPARGGPLAFPVNPGEQTVAAEWTLADGLSPRYQIQPPQLGAAGVNATVTLELPRGRWLLLAGGPQLGPAVLLWSWLPLLLLAAWALSHWLDTPLRFRDWLLLGLGLAFVSLPLALVVVIWLAALAGRRHLGAEVSPWRFNLAQLILVLLTLVAAGVLLAALQTGLLGAPEMLVTGNGSSAWRLVWYQDRFAETLPAPWALSLPLWAYRGLMLLWALWLARQYVKWLVWGWEGFTRGGWWRSVPPLWQSLKAGKERPGAAAGEADKGAS